MAQTVETELGALLHELTDTAVSLCFGDIGRFTAARRSMRSRMDPRRLAREVASAGLRPRRRPSWPIQSE